MNGKASIVLENYSLSYPIFSNSARSLKKSFFRGVKRRVADQSHVGGSIVDHGDTSFVRALDQVSVSITKGERVGLIGHNGAGKSTFLKAVSGIFESSQGALRVQGEVHALLDAQSGMNSYLTGRENIRLFARTLGYDRSKAKALEEDVEEFAELGAFIDMPVRFYSSGMAVRVGFALATSPRPEILLMDEWFMAGDHHFQTKAEERLRQLIDHVQILVVTSHSLSILEKWCNRLLWMEGGRVHRDGPPKDILQAYRQAMLG